VSAHFPLPPQPQPHIASFHYTDAKRSVDPSEREFLNTLRELTESAMASWAASLSGDHLIFEFDTSRQEAICLRSN
jgi:hypothetical protein